MHAPPTRVLMVCLGNICRSPMAEGILRQRAAEAGLNIEVDSAGTADYHVGEAPDRRAQQALAEHGMDISGLRGRQLKATDLDTFDHILVMDRSNLRNTLALARTEAQRQKVRLLLPDASEVPDPYYGEMDGFRALYLMLDDAVGQLLRNTLR
jgi:protein-tyrosine phosphatase